MYRTFLRSKIHRAVVTAADVNYEGSVSIGRKLCAAANLLEFEQVDIYDISNGSRLTTYVIYGEEGEIQINGAAARLIFPGDLVIIAAYGSFSSDEIPQMSQPAIIHVDSRNRPRKMPGPH